MRKPQKPRMQCPSCKLLAPCPCIAPQWTTGGTSPPKRVALAAPLGRICGVWNEESMLGATFRTRKCSMCGHEFNTMEIGHNSLINFVKQGIDKAVASALQSIEEATKKAVQSQVVSPKLFSSTVTIMDAFEPSVIVIGG